MNSREIKFRVWSKQSKKFLSLKEENPYTTSLCFSPEPRVITRYCDSFDSSEDDIIIQQFTGLQDKNGKDIYEGDIVSYSFEIKGEKVIYTDEVFFENGSYRFGPHDRSAADNLFGKNLFCEVIGNIFETPELIS